MNDLIGLYTRNGWQDPKSLPAMVAQRDQARNPIIKEVNEYLHTRDPNKKAAITKARAESWPKYEAKLNLAAYTKFKDNYDKFLDAADKLIDQRTVELIKWLEAPLFIDTLEDFHGSNIRDGVEFEDVVGDAIFGMSSSPSGAKKLEAWAKEAKASIKDNIAWRAVALNQKEAIAEVDQALAAAKAHQTPLTESAWNGLLASLKSLQRMADTYKKAQKVYNDNERAKAAAAPNAPPAAIAANKALGVQLKPVNSRNIDKVAITFFDAVYKVFRINKAGDYLSEKVIQHVFSIRAFVEPEDSRRLIVAQAVEQKLANREIMNRLNAAKDFITPTSDVTYKAQAPALKQAWDQFKATPGGVTAMKDARLAVIVGLIEGANFAKLWHESEGKISDRAKILASAMTISAAMADVAATPAKALFGNEAVSYQKIKLIGGALGGMASMIGAGVDFANAGKEWDKNPWGVAILIYAKSLAGATSGLLTLAATFTYSAGVVKRLAGQGAADAVTLVGKKAGAIVAKRILFMAAGAWVTVILIVLEGLIWVFSDNELQDWCEKCVFGTHPDQNMITRKADKQMEAFGKAMGEVV